MAYTIDLVKDPKYVSLVLTGKVARAEHESSTEGVNLTLTANNCKRLLVDATRADHKMTMLDNFDFASALRSRHQIGIRIAVLILPDDFKDLQFVETVAQNRGVNLTVFEDKVKALNWLLDS